MNKSYSIFTPVDSGANISRDEKHRFDLWRVWAARKPQYAFIMLNPSTADAATDDNTIAKCRRYTLSWGGGGFHVLNLFTLRSTDPRVLYGNGDLNRPESDAIMRDVVAKILACDGKIVLGWGVHGNLNHRDEEVLQILNSMGAEPQCFEMTAGGHPRHPLYCKGNVKPIPFKRAP